MPNIWHLAHQITKTTLHQLFQISKNLRHGYSTVSNMRRYGEKCYTLFTLFNPFFLSPSIRYLSCLSVSFSRSLCFGMSLPLHLSLSLFWPSHHRRSHHAERQRPPCSPLITTHFAMKRNSNVKDTVAGSENFHQRRQRWRFGMWVCLFW